MVRFGSLRGKSAYTTAYMAIHRTVTRANKGGHSAVVVGLDPLRGQRMDRAFTWIDAAAAGL